MILNCAIDGKKFIPIKTKCRKSSRIARFILFSKPQMRVLLEFGPFCLMFFKFSASLIRMGGLFEGGSLSRIYGRYAVFAAKL